MNRIASALLLAVWTLHAGTSFSADTGVPPAVRDCVLRVLPPHDNDPFASPLVCTNSGKPWTFYVAASNGVPVGTAFTATSPRGYAGPVEVVVGVSASGTVTRVEVTAMRSETPAVSARVAQPVFLAQFAGKPVRSTEWLRLKADGGGLDAVTGATVTSRAVLDAVRRGLEAYRAHAATLNRTAGTP